MIFDSYFRTPTERSRGQKQCFWYFAPSCHELVYLETVFCQKILWKHIIMALFWQLAHSDSVLSECFIKIHYFNNVLTVCSPRHDLETPFKNQFFSIFSKSKYAMKKRWIPHKYLSYEQYSPHPSLNRSEIAFKYWRYLGNLSAMISFIFKRY